MRLMSDQKIVTMQVASVTKTQTADCSLKTFILNNVV